MTEPFSRDQAFIDRLSEIVLENLHNENFGVNDLAHEARLSRSVIHRRLREIRNQNITQFIREIRLKRAMELLQNNAGPVSDIAFKVGFGSPIYFSKCFHEYYGYPPGEARKRIVLKEEDTNEPVVEDTVGSNQSQSEVSETIVARRKINRKLIIFLSLAVIVMAAIVVILLEVPWRQVKDPSIVLLPFKNLSDDQENQYFADGVMEDILNNLNRIKEFRVISRTTAEKFRGTEMTLPEIAKKLM